MRNSLQLASVFSRSESVLFHSMLFHGRCSINLIIKIFERILLLSSLLTLLLLLLLDPHHREAPTLSF